jgi:chemotaxis protein MotB
MPVTNAIKRRLIIGSVLSAVVLTGCVSRSDYNALETQNRDLQANNQDLQTKNQQLQQQVAMQTADVERLRGAIKYTVDSDLLFPSGGWQISTRGQQIITSMAAKLAPSQQNKIVVSGYTDNHPVGLELQRQGISSNQMLSEKRAENVMQYMISQGVNAELVSARGFGDANAIVSNDTAPGRAQNRRVELTLAAPGS